MNKYANIEVNAENVGAINTQTFLISKGKAIFCNRSYIKPAVIMIPGYKVDPTILPKGYHESGSNQFQSS